ncbi:TPA: hypothetical protein ACSVZR_000038 [Bacillus cereus]|uniref:hypothetical protein n=1 Tax=Bacillus sp. ABP14 TaxID=1892404 RepID=UPI000A823552|nr:hypothetical protein [Bacillus sp. ABP14]
MKQNFIKIHLHIHDFQTLKLLLEEIIQDEIELFEGFSKYTLHISSKESKITINLRSELFPKPYLAIGKKNSKINLYEAKASLTAPLTKNQKAAFPEIEKYGAIVKGKGKPPLVGGTEIPPSKVEVVRKQ